MVKNMQVTLYKQEREDNYKFDTQIVYTKGMESQFGENIFMLIYKTMNQIQELVNKGIADYFQVATVEYMGSTTKFYIIDDIDHITFLLPEEY